MTLFFLKLKQNVFTQIAFGIFPLPNSVTLNQSSKI